MAERAHQGFKMWFETKAKIKYDPHRGEMKKRTSWWAVANIIDGHDLCAYYRHYVKTVYGIELAQPSWGPHISIIRGEKPSNGKPWGYRDGEIVTVKYKHHPRIAGDTCYTEGQGNFWFLDVEVPELKAIRDYYGRPSDWKMHLTFGRVWKHEDTITTRTVI